MSRLTKTKTDGNRRLIIYTGTAEQMAEAMHQLACIDPEFQRSLLTAAIALHHTRKAHQVGDQLCQMILNPANP